MYKMDFKDVAVGTCEPSYIEPFSIDLHLFGVQCKQAPWALIVVLVLTIGIKLYQNWLYTKIGQLQRELLQIDKEKEAREKKASDGGGRGRAPVQAHSTGISKSDYKIHGAIVKEHPETWRIAQAFPNSNIGPVCIHCWTTIGQKYQIRCDERPP